MLGPNDIVSRHLTSSEGMCGIVVGMGAGGGGGCGVVVVLVSGGGLWVDDAVKLQPCILYEALFIYQWPELDRLELMWEGFWGLMDWWDDVRCAGVRVLGRMCCGVAWIRRVEN